MTTQERDVVKLLRRQYRWPRDYLRKQKWSVDDCCQRLGARHDAQWLARHIHRQLSPIYL
jgi:hypothetical protein